MSKIPRILFLVYLILLNNFALYAQHSRDYGRDYSDIEPTFFSREQIFSTSVCGTQNEN